MDVQDIEHLTELVKAHRRRLYILETKAATFGLDTPPQILTEIEDVKAAIADINAQLKAAQKSSVMSQQPPSPKNPDNTSIARQKIEIVMRGDFKKVNPELQGAFVRALAAIVDIPPEHIEVLRVIEGSIVVVVELPKDAAERLIEMHREGNPLLEELGVESIVELELIYDSVASMRDKQMERGFSPVSPNIIPIILLISAIVLSIFLFIGSSFTNFTKALILYGTEIISIFKLIDLINYYHNPMPKSYYLTSLLGSRQEIQHYQGANNRMYEFSAPIVSIEELEAFAMQIMKGDVIPPKLSNSTKTLYATLFSYLYLTGSFWAIKDISSTNAFVAPLLIAMSILTLWAVFSLPRMKYLPVFDYRKSFGREKVED